MKHSACLSECSYECFISLVVKSLTSQQTLAMFQNKHTHSHSTQCLSRDRQDGNRQCNYYIMHRMRDRERKNGGKSIAHPVKSCIHIHTSERKVHVTALDGVFGCKSCNRVCLVVWVHSQRDLYISVAAKRERERARECHPTQSSDGQWLLDLFDLRAYFVVVFPCVHICSGGCCVWRECASPNGCRVVSTDVDDVDDGSNAVCCSSFVFVLPVLCTL